MNVVVLINGREAIPVRAIPFIAPSTVSADTLVRGLSGVDRSKSLFGLVAYKLLGDGSYRKVLDVEWPRYANELQALQDGIKREQDAGQITEAEGRRRWRRESVKALPAGVFVWKDDFVKAHARAFRRLSEQEIRDSQYRYRDSIQEMKAWLDLPDDDEVALLMANSLGPDWRATYSAYINDMSQQDWVSPESVRMYVPNYGGACDPEALSDVTFVEPCDDREMYSTVMEAFEHFGNAGPADSPIFSKQELAQVTEQDGEIAQMLAKWFDRKIDTIDDLPPQLRPIVEAYIPSWLELSGADRRAQAAKADFQVQATLGARFEMARMEVEQSNAAMPDRFKERDFQDGFNKVEREKNGERDFEAKRGAVNLSDERCIELARSPKLGIIEWIELTRVGIGKCDFFRISDDGVRFIKWENDFIEAASEEWQIDMLRDNQHEPLEFPCTPARMIDFIDTDVCTIRGCFSVPDAFRQAVTESAPTPDTPQQVSDEAQERSDTTHSGTSEKTETPAERRAKHDMTTERGCRRMILENWVDIEKLHGPKPSVPQIRRIVVRKLQDDEQASTLKTFRNVRDVLRKEGLIP